MSRLTQSFLDKAPAYIDDIGLNYPPFSNVADDHFVYSSDAEKKFWAWLNLAIDNAPVMLVLIGSKESQKTSQLRRIGSMTPGKWYTGRHNASNLKTPNQLLELLAQDLKISLGGFSPEENIRELMDHWITLKDRGVMPVLMIDDAHLLAPVLLEILLRLGQLTGDKHESGLLSLILFSECSLKEPMLTNDYCRLHIDRVIELSILGLLDEMTADYLNFRLNKAGYRGEPLFCSDEITQLTRQSARLPGKINLLAHEMLLRKGNSYTLNSPQPNKGLTKAVFGTGTVTMIGAALMIFNTLRDPIDNWFTDDANIIKMEAVILSDKKVEHNTGAIPAPDSGKDELVVEQKMALSGNLSDQNLPEIEQKKTGNTSIVQTKAIASLQLAKLISPQNKDTIPEISQPTNTAKKWLSERNPDHYTIQLVGSSKYQTLLTFIDKKNLQDKAILLHSRKFNRNWYSVVLGDYNGYSTAKLALKQLDPDIARDSPWLRRFADLQHDALTSTEDF